MVPLCYDVRLVAAALVWQWCPSAKMYDLLPLLWSGRCAPMLRCTICCRCFGLEVVPQCKDVRFVAFALLKFFPFTLTVEPEVAKFRGQGVLTLGGALILVGSDYPSKTADG